MHSQLICKSEHPQQLLLTEHLLRAGHSSRNFTSISLMLATLHRGYYRKIPKYI